MITQHLFRRRPRWWRGLWLAVIAGLAFAGCTAFAAHSRTAKAVENGKTAGLMQDPPCRKVEGNEGRLTAFGLNGYGTVSAPGKEESL
jgi:hypothetical protein